MSGFTPKNSLAPPQASLAPVLTSSKNQQRAVFGADIAQALEKSGLREAETDVHQNGLENNRGDLTGILLKAILDALQIVEAGDDNILKGGLGHATAAGTELGASGSP